jgi:hypothetical protein
MKENTDEECNERRNTDEGMQWKCSRMLMENADKY